MSTTPVILEFGSLALNADLFDHPIARALLAHLPVSVPLTRWGDELYGPLSVDLGSHNPVPDIPPGGIAYSQNGSYLCVFFGQRPAWPVDYIGQISGDSWKSLEKQSNHTQVILRRASYEPL